ncbi:hypothetical protein BS78_09G048800 [Paspalum vaginatum]|nr:hypothetical protein BS78_09G048800 [Paspalum vaginatum]
MHLATTIGYGRMGICAWPPRLNLGIISGCLPNGQAWAGMKHLATDPRSRMLVLEMPDMLYAVILLYSVTCFTCFCSITNPSVLFLPSWKGMIIASLFL